MYQWNKFKNIFSEIFNFNGKAKKSFNELSTNSPVSNQIISTPTPETSNSANLGTPPPSDRIEKISNQLKDLKDKAEYSLKLSKDAIDLVIIGFIALVIVVIGIGYGFWQFIYTASKNDDYRYNISEKINRNTQDIYDIKKAEDNFKNCLKNGGWNTCLNLK